MATEEMQGTANAMRQQAETIKVLAELGFDKEKAVQAVVAGDLAQLID